MSSYIVTKKKRERKEAILKMDLEELPEYYRKIFKDFLLNHKFSEYEEKDKFLDTMIFQKYKINNCNVYEKEDEFYNALKQYEKFFCKMYQFEVSYDIQSLLVGDRIYFTEKDCFKYLFSKMKSLDFDIKSFYIICACNKFTKKVSILIYDGLDKDKFLRCLNQKSIPFPPLFTMQ